jgi:DNA repair protein RadC
MTGRAQRQADDDPIGVVEEIATADPHPDFEAFDPPACVEWNSSTKALTEFLAALGVSDAPTNARHIIEEFGTLADVLSASSWRLRRVVGTRLAATIQSSHRMMIAMLEEQVIDGPVIHRSDKLIELLQAQVGFLDHERALALYVDGQGRLMRIECVGEGSVNAAMIDRRAVIGCALSIGAAAFLLVHNHPGGSPQPSGTDVHLSNDLARVARDLDLTMLDHLIVSRGRIQPIFDWWQEGRQAGEKWADD